MKTFNVRVLDTLYKVSVGTRSELNLWDDQLGNCNFYDKTIQVVTDLSEVVEPDVSYSGVVKEVILHELCHAFLYESGRVKDAEGEEWAEYLSVIIPKIVSAEEWFHKLLDNDSI